jgi:formylglycine-generating enzyme required for sulfatase activity
MTSEGYDVALSFAGEDREYARTLHEELSHLGVHVFYDYDEAERASLFGKDLDAHLSDLFQNRAQYVIIFVSKHYAQKFWTGIEKRAALARAARENREYILPICLDETEIEGIPHTTGWLTWSQTGAREIAEHVLKKLGAMVNRRDGAAMVFVGAGDFIMGSDSSDEDKVPDEDQRPARSVYLSSYYIYKNPVTVAQYRAFEEATGYARTPPSHFHGTDEHPKVDVTWYNAEAYCKWAGVSLPTEAQWEKAARGTDGRLYPWGNDWNGDACEHHRLVESGPAGIPVRIGSYLRGRSPYGALDMVGNIWEWCADWYDPKYYERAPASDPMGPDSGTRRVRRGCGWEDIHPFPLNFSCAYRDTEEPGFYYVLTGFRCVGPPSN